MTTCLGKSCSFGLPRVPFRKLLSIYVFKLIISLVVFRAECGVWLYHLLIHCLSFYFESVMYTVSLDICKSLVDDLLDQAVLILHNHSMGYSRLFCSSNDDILYTWYMPDTVNLSIQTLHMSNYDLIFLSKQPTGADWKTTNIYGICMEISRD